MREILFRGKHLDNGEWIEGDFCAPDSDDGLPYISCTGYNGIHPVYPDTVGQFTGLYDKNKKRIFEGDICIGAWGTVVQIYWDDDYAQFRGKPVSGLSREIDYFGLDKLEVIGNIHDNPELMEAQK